MVKFGKYLIANQVSEWSSQYIRYKKLKKTIKQIAAAQKEKRQQTTLQPADAEAFALSSAVWAAHHLEAGRDRRDSSASESRPATASHATYSDNSDIENQQDRAQRDFAGEEHKNGGSGALGTRSLSALKGALDDGALPHPSSSPPLPSVLARSSSFEDDSDHQHQEHRRTLARINSLVNVMGPSALQLYKQPSLAIGTRSSPGARTTRLSHSEAGSEIEMTSTMGVVAAAASTESEMETLGGASAVPSALSSSSPATVAPSPSGSGSGSGSLSSSASASGSLSLRSVLPSALRSDTYERIFFEILEEDLQRINAFFLEMEKFFMEKLDVISKQISAFLEAETESAPVLHPAAAHGGEGGDARASPPQSNPHASHFSSAYKLRSKASRAKSKSALSKALRELYRGLNLLKNFRILNFTGVVKILKKHDKISEWKLGGEVLPIVQESYFFASPVLESFLERVEAMYVGAFAAGDRRKGMDVLRPSTPPLSGWLLFSLGFTAGLCLILVCILTGLLVWSTRYTSPPLLPSSAIAIAPLFRCLFLLLLAVWLWAGLVWAYQKHQLNWTFILETNHTFLRVPQILSVACKGSLLYFSCLDVYLFLLLLKEQAMRHAAAHPEDPSLQDAMFMHVEPEWVHGALWLCLLAVVLCPLRIFYYHTRKYLLSTLRNVFTAPLTTVSFRDFFVADWICSLVSVFADLSYTGCFYLTGSFHHNEKTQCADVNTHYILWFVSFIPSWWRFAQSVRRWRDTTSKRHLCNATKYFIGALVTLTSLLDKNWGGPSSAWRSLWICTAVFGTLVAFLWDILIDWGLWSGVLDRTSSDQLLRPKLTLEHRWIYHQAIITNMLLRVVWVLTISPAYTPPWIAPDVKSWILYTLELLRRAQWSFYRLENEHLNNAGQFRAVNIVPIPMDTMDDEEVAEKLVLSRAPIAASLLSDPDVRQRIEASRLNSIRRGLGSSAAGIHVENGHLVISAGKGGRPSMYARTRALPVAVSENESEDGDHAGSRASHDERGGSGPQDTATEQMQLQDTYMQQNQQQQTPPMSPRALSSEAPSASPPPSARLRPPQQPDSGAAVGAAAASGARRTSVSQQSSDLMVVVHSAAPESSSDTTSSSDSVEPDERRQQPTASLQLHRTPSQDKHARKKARREKRRKRIEAAAANADDDSLPASHDMNRDDSSGSSFRARPEPRLHRTLSGRTLTFPRPLKSLSRNSSNTRLDQMGGSRAEGGLDADAEKDVAASQAASSNTTLASGSGSLSAFNRPPSASNRPLSHDSAERIRYALSEESETGADSSQRPHAQHAQHAQLHTVTESGADLTRTSTPPI